MGNNESDRKENAPKARFQLGSVSASVFVNTVTRGDGSTFQVHRTVLQKVYRDPKSGEFCTTRSLDVNDLPRAILALEKAFEFCITTSHSKLEDE